MRNSFIAFVLVLLPLPALATPAGEGFRKLSANEIRRPFVGREFTDEVHFSDHYQGDGTIDSTSMSHKLKKKWRIQKDQLCITSTFGEFCSDVWKKGKSVKLLLDRSDIMLDGIVQ